MDCDERTLIQDARQGDTRAFEVLVRRYDRRVLGLAYEMTGNAEDAQDIYQEALIAAYRGLPGFRMRSDFFTWLYRIAVNQALRFRRRYATGYGSAQPIPDGEYGDVAAVETTPEDLALNKELQTQIEDAMATLSAQERMAFVLCHHQGVKIRQAAELMSCSAGSVKTYLFRARDKMRARLRKYLET